MSNSNELYHYRVKGMRWGVRRYQNNNGQYTTEGKKRYVADKTKNYQGDLESRRKYNVNSKSNRNKNRKLIYTKDAYNMNNGKLGQAYDKLTDAHKYRGHMLYAMSSAKARKERADKYITDTAKARNRVKQAIAH